MRKGISIFIIMILLIITGCSNKEVIKHNYCYKGENEFWTAEYKVNGTGTFTENNDKTEYDSSCEKVFTITYNKDISQLASVKHLEISYKSRTANGKITEDYSNGLKPEKTYTLKSNSSGVAIENKDEVIDVTINIDGEIQTIELKN